MKDDIDNEFMQILIQKSGSKKKLLFGERASKKADYDNLVNQFTLGDTKIEKPKVYSTLEKDIFEAIVDRILFEEINEMLLLERAASIMVEKIMTMKVREALSELIVIITITRDLYDSISLHRSQELLTQAIKGGVIRGLALEVYTDLVRKHTGDLAFEVMPLPTETHKEPDIFRGIDPHLNTLGRSITNEMIEKTLKDYLKEAATELNILKKPQKTLMNILVANEIYIDLLKDFISNVTQTSIKMHKEEDLLNSIIDDYTTDYVKKRIGLIYYDGLIVTMIISELMKEVCDPETKVVANDTYFKAQIVEEVLNERIRELLRSEVISEGVDMLKKENSDFTRALGEIEFENILETYIIRIYQDCIKNEPYSSLRVAEKIVNSIVKEEESTQFQTIIFNSLATSMATDEMITNYIKHKNDEIYIWCIDIRTIADEIFNDIFKDLTQRIINATLHKSEGEEELLEELYRNIFEDTLCVHGVSEITLNCVSEYHAINSIIESMVNPFVERKVIEIAREMFNSEMAKRLAEEISLSMIDTTVNRMVNVLSSSQGQPEELKGKLINVVYNEFMNENIMRAITNCFFTGNPSQDVCNDFIKRVTCTEVEKIFISYVSFIIVLDNLVDPLIFPLVKKEVAANYKISREEHIKYLKDNNLYEEPNIDKVTLSQLLEIDLDYKEKYTKKEVIENTRINKELQKLNSKIEEKRGQCAAEDTDLKLIYIKQLELINELLNQHSVFSL